ncbi:MAG: GIY-YIG nuclease family protein [Candidatus Omnitrophota bacterium]
MKKIKRNAKFYVYILECRDGSYYTGYSGGLDARIKRHNQGLASKYTRVRLPVKLVWTKTCKNQRFAMRIEARIKQLERIDKERLVRGYRLDNILRRKR